MFKYYATLSIKQEHCNIIFLLAPPILCYSCYAFHLYTCYKFHNTLLFCLKWGLVIITTLLRHIGIHI